MKSLLLITAACGISTATYASIVSMNFDIADTADLSALIDAANPTAGQFNSINNYTDAAAHAVSSIVGGKLVTIRDNPGANNTRNQSNMIRNFAAQGAVVVTFEANFTGSVNLLSSGQINNNGVNLFLNMENGHGLNNVNTPSIDGVDVVGRAAAFSYLSFVLDATQGWSLATNIPNSSSSYVGPFFSGAQTVTWVTNNSGAEYSYTDPNMGTSSVLQGQTDLWIGTTQVADGLILAAGVTSIDQFMIRWHRATMDPSWTLTLDNLTIVPEPSTYAILLGGIVLGFVALRRRK